MTAEREREAERVREVYRRRSERNLDSRYSYWQRANLYTFQTRERDLLRLLERRGLLPITGLSVLDAGCGNGAVLADFLRYGSSPADLHGVDLLPDRIESARETLPGADLRVGDAQALPFEDSAFDLVLAFTLLSSIVTPDRRIAVARELARVARPGGLVLIYDFWINPFNRDARALRRQDVRDLFAGREVEFSAVTLLPPLVRLLAPRPGGWFACSVLEVLPFMRTHFLAAVQM